VASDRELAAGLLRRAEEDLLVGHSYPMQTGEHTNYWPYWQNYRAPLQKLLAQTPVGSEAYLILKNRIEDVLNRKTVFNWNRHVDEQDFEASISGALVQRRTYSPGPGQRVSLATGSRPQRPSYEVLNLASSGLPAEHRALAGLPVVRYPDGSLRFDWQGPGVQPSRVSQPVPAELSEYVTAQRVAAQELGVRGLVAGEEARPGIPWDWNQDGGIELQTYSAEELWDVAGALTSDHEAGWAIPGSLRMKATQVEETQFVGSRNNGGHWLLIDPGAGRRRIRVDAEVKQLWHKSDASKKYDDPAQRFRRDLPAGDGSFAPNPDWVAAEASDEDDITIDAQGRRLVAVVKYVTLDEQGEREQRIEAVELDPSQDAAVKVAEEVQDIGPGGVGGKVVEHWYNPKSGCYSNVVIEVGGAGKPRRELARSEPAPAARVLACQETVYDSVIEIHDFVTARMGLPFVFDTSSGMAVWNYPVSEIGIDKLGQLERSEDGQRYEYTSYRLRYVTMGGPKGEARYIIKRDARGQAERALALDPMPDFAFRQDRWVCAPAASDAQGHLAINVHALKAGYLTDKGGNARPRSYMPRWPMSLRPRMAPSTCSRPKTARCTPSRAEPPLSRRSRRTRSCVEPVSSRASWGAPA
jgi:DNA-binding transcriptional regulator YdaS (Cro superfamily)